MSQLHEKLFRKDRLKVKSILEAEDLMLSISVSFTFGNGNNSPLVLMSPCGHVSQDLRLADSAVSPKENTRIGSLEMRKRNSSAVLWSPEAIADLVVPTQI